MWSMIKSECSWGQQEWKGFPYREERVSAGISVIVAVKVRPLRAAINPGTAMVYEP